MRPLKNPGNDAHPGKNSTELIMNVVFRLWVLQENKIGKSCSWPTSYTNKTFFDTKYKFFPSSAAKLVHELYRSMHIIRKWRIQQQHHVCTCDRASLKCMLLSHATLHSSHISWQLRVKSLSNFDRIDTFLSLSLLARKRSIDTKPLNLARNCAHHQFPSSRIPHGRNRSSARALISINHKEKYAARTRPIR